MLPLDKDNADIGYLRDCLDYCPESGVLTWKSRPSTHFKKEYACKAWNTKFATKVAGYKAEDGYIEIAILKRTYKAHRIAWAIYHGDFADMFIDHINGNKSDNSINNLRVVNKRENGVNSRIHGNNKSGTSGVCWCKRTNRWEAYIRDGIKKVHLGRFASIDDAVSARKLAEIKYGYHENHGRR